MKHLFFAYAWLLLGVGVILTGVATVSFFSTELSTSILPPGETAANLASDGSTTGQVLGESKGIETTIEVEDARAAIVANFLERYDSPLKPYSHFGAVFVDIADRYGFDFRLLPAIAMQESNLCKKIPADSYNCLGFGVHSRGTLAFENFEANFERAGRELKANYIEIGLDTPEKIMRKYTPGSNGSWADSVNQWMAEMKYNDRQLGREEKKDASVLEFVATQEK